jgi:hypothetical protein
MAVAQRPRLSSLYLVPCCTSTRFNEVFFYGHSKLRRIFLQRQPHC